MSAAERSRSDRLASLENEVGVFIRQIKRVIGQRAAAVHPDLTAASFLMLGYLDKHGALRSSAISEGLGLDKGAVTRQLQHLEELGLVERTADPDDGRASLVEVTPSARLHLQVVAAQRRRWLDERLADWSDADLDQLVELLARYNRTLG